MVGMSWLISNKVLVAAASDNFVKIYDFSATQIVGGGSLNKRLDGAALSCMEVDGTTCRVFLGTNKGMVLAYQIDSTNYQMKYLYSISLPNVGHRVSCLLFSHG